MTAISRPMPVPDLAGLLAPPRRPKALIEPAELSGEGPLTDAEPATAALNSVVAGRGSDVIGVTEPSVARRNLAPGRGGAGRARKSSGAAASSGVASDVPGAGESTLSARTLRSAGADADVGEAVETGGSPIPSPPSRVLKVSDPKPLRTETESPKGRQDGRGATPSNLQTGRAYLQSKTVYMPRSLHQRLTAEAKSRGTTATALILRAVNSTHAVIGGAMRAAESPSDGDLFEVAQGHRAAEPSVQTSIRITDQQLSAIQSLSATHSITRSKLICVALDLFLDE